MLDLSDLSKWEVIESTDEPVPISEKLFISLVGIITIGAVLAPIIFM